MSPDEYAAFQTLFHKLTGIQFGKSKRHFVDKRLVTRATERGCRSVAQYLDSLSLDFDGEEMQALINAMTVNETYFYREQHQFHALVKDILPEIVAGRAKGEKVRIWSLPCSTGEEPYSLALYLLETWRIVDDYEVEIIASDIDTAVLAQARRGVFDARSVQRLPAETLARYFIRLNGGNVQICDALRSSVDFRAVNVSDAQAMRSFRGFDVVFCRNLLIYFSEASRREAVREISAAMRPGGFCCLGHSESMTRISDAFRQRRFADAIVYQKPTTTEPLPSSRKRSGEAASQGGCEGMDSSI